mgnify:CR=1 FL=1
MTWEARPRSEVGGLSAIVSGTGPSVVMIHGVGLRAEAWNRQIEALEPFLRVIAIDMPGHGDSAPLKEAAPALSDFSDALAAALTEPALVFGHSMGAMIALDLAIRFPDRLRGVAALNAVFNRSAAASKAVQARAENLDGTSRVDPAGTLLRWFGDVDSPEKEACRMWLCGMDPSEYRKAYHVFATEDGPRRDDLSALTCPVLFATGSSEPNSTPEMTREMASLTPRGRSEIVDGATHMMPMTHADEVNPILLEFARANSE